MTTRTTRLGRSAILALLVLVIASLLGAGLLQSADARSGTDPSTTDARIGPKSCALLGRAYVKGYGCSRTTCVDPSDYMKRDANAETCIVGGRDGHPYGQPIDERVCSALHRTWVGVVNYCVSNPHRGQLLIPDAPQCAPPYSTYLTLTEAQGYYDLCLTPRRVDLIRNTARRGGVTLSEQAAVMSQPLCTTRPRAQFLDGYCHRETGPIPQADRGGVLLIGDSVSWRGTNELARKRPDWTIDGVPYRHVNKLFARIGRFGIGHARPQGLIVALGTNPSPHWTRADYARVLKRTTGKGIVMFVTPYRAAGTSTPGTVAATGRYSSYMKGIARRNRHVCVADWRSLVKQRPALLVDGVHPTSYGEGVWASFIARSWHTCVGLVKKQDAAVTPPTSDPGDPGTSDPGTGDPSDPPSDPGGGGPIPPITLPPIIPIIIGGLGLGL